MSVLAPVLSFQAILSAAVLLDILGWAFVPREQRGDAPATQTRSIGEFIFTSAPYPSCHASTIVELHNGDLIAAWFGGTAESRPDVAVWGSRRTAGRWSAPVELAREPDIATYNPVLFYATDGRLWLYYKFGPGPSAWTAARRWSADDGQTWSQIEHLPAGVYGPIRAKPLVLSDGSIVSGTCGELWLVGLLG